MAKIPTRNFKYTMTNFNIDEPVDIEVHCSVDGLIKIDYVRDLLDQLKNIKGYKFTVFCTVL